MDHRVDIRPAFLNLFRECFEGRPEGQDHTFFVEGKEGIFDALANVSAERASLRPNPSTSSIAAHAYHILFALQLDNSFIGGPPVEGDWESSWSKQNATPEEWQQLQQDIRSAYQFFGDWFEKSFPDQVTDPAMFASPFAALPHMAYHLGAIRQLMKVV